MTRTVATCALILGLAAAGLPTAARAQDSEKWANGAIWAKPLSNPVYNDIAMIKREVNLLYVYQTLPSHIESIGLKLALDGDLNAVAVQFELPLADSLSLVANKSGYIDFNPDNLLQKNGGAVDLAAGLKWAFLNCENYALAARATVEFPIGDEDVFQGNGDGNVSPALLGTYIVGNNCFNAVVGAVLPLDGDEESSLGYLSAAHAFKVTDWLSSHVELNWFHVIDPADADDGFNGQFGQLIPTVVEFEGGDLINLGAREGDHHGDSVSLALGARVQIGQQVSLGASYEIPLSNTEHGLMDERATAHVTVTF